MLMKQAEITVSDIASSVSSLPGLRGFGSEASSGSGPASGGKPRGSSAVSGLGVMSYAGMPGGIA
jgi:hypothetical protein